MDLFSTLSEVELSAIRQRLINAIMWTDMAKHFDMVAKLDGKIQVHIHPKLLLLLIGCCCCC